MEPLKFAILYICTGRYTLFWDAFFRSCEQNFMPGHERHYFVFTDQRLSVEHGADVTVLEQEHLGWPGMALKRFHILGRVAPLLPDFDHVFFFNANCRFYAAMDTSILPREDQDLLLVQHPGTVFQARENLPFERDPRSCAHIPPDKGEYYVCGAVNGGTADAFASLIEYGRNAVDLDERNGVTAAWHDESHLNRYVLDRPCRILHAGYCYPEGWTLPFPRMIEVRDKALLGGHDFLRGTTDTPIRPGKPSVLSKVRGALRAPGRHLGARRR